MVVWGRLFSETPGFETIELCEDTYILGRHEDCTVRYTDPSISSKHCIITRVSSLVVEPLRQLCDAHSPRPNIPRSGRKTAPHSMPTANSPSGWKIAGRYPQISLHYPLFPPLILRVPSLALSSPPLFSSNGTYVNGQRVGKGKRMALFHNNKLSLTNRNKHSPSYIFHDARTASETTHPALRDRYNIMKALGRCVVPSTFGEQEPFLSTRPLVHCFHIQWSLRRGPPGCGK